MPGPLRAAIDRELERIPLSELQRAAASLSTRYRAELRDGRLHLNGELAVKAYLATRLPATYAAVRVSMEMAAERMPDFAPATLLDVGAGPGTALWAASDCWPSLGRATLVEASEPARRIAAQLAAGAFDLQIDWLAGDAEAALATAPKAELVTLCYVLDEIDGNARPALIDRLWSLTQAMLLIVEPGTPAGWRRILEARSQLIEAGGYIVAPCPHDAPCPLMEPDWCHFSQRLPRSRIHRLTKEGDAPFEDEKYIFVTASRFSGEDRPSRVLAPPHKGKAWVDLKLCQPDGSARPVQVSKRDGDAYRAAKRLDWGDAFSL